MPNDFPFVGHARLTQIQDQVGARIIVFYLADVEPIAQRILKYNRSIE
jgi:hypothetical protein